MVSRRQFFTIAGAAAAAGALGLTGCSNDTASGGGDPANADLQLAWWGNDVRNAMTTKAIDAYTTANPGVKISPQPGEWASYWDKIATQTAGNTAPDIIQMDMAYISEYADRGALLDLGKYGVDTSKFTEGTVDSGRLNDELVGVNAGVNTLTLLANPDVFKKAGIELPDDMKWTWDDYLDIATEISAKGGSGVTGTGSAFGSDNLLQIWLRQNGKDTFTTEGLGFTADDLRPYLELMVKFQNAKAIPTPQQISEETGKSLDQSYFGTGKQGLSLFWSNQVAAASSATGVTLKTLRPPTVAGDAMQRNAWYKASMLWSASARTKNPEAVGAVVNWWVNNTAAADICLDERGVPANSEMVTEIEPKLTDAGKLSTAYVKDVAAELGDPVVAPPVGGSTLGEVLTRYTTDIMFGRATVADASTKIVDELTQNLK